MNTKEKMIESVEVEESQKEEATSTKETENDVNLKEEEEEELKERLKPSTSSAKKAGPSIIQTFGKKSDDVASIKTKDAKKIEKEEARKQRVLNELTKAAETSEVLWGTVSSVGPFSEDSEAKDGLVFHIRYNGVDVMVFENQFFLGTSMYGTDYESKSDYDKLEQRLKYGSRYVGSISCFTPTYVGKFTINDKIVEGCIASRLGAMEIIKNKHFYHLTGSELVDFVNGKKKGLSKKDSETIDEIYKPLLNPNRKETEFVDVSIGSICEAHVVQARSDYVTVEVLGCETRIDAFNLRDGFTYNCGKVHPVGDVFPVRIRKLYEKREDVDDMYLSVTGRFVKAPEEITTLRKGTSCLGKVDHHVKGSAGEGYYVVHLENGVQAKVYEGGVVGNIPLTNGDRVVVSVKKIAEYNVTGTALKI